MNFNPFRSREIARREFEPDMDATAQDMREPQLPAEVRRCARRIKIEDAIEEHVKSFMDVPMQAIDKLEAELREETETTFEYGQKVRNAINKVVADYAAHLKMRTAMTRVTKEHIALMADEYAQLSLPLEQITDHGSVGDHLDIQAPEKEAAAS